MYVEHTPHVYYSAKVRGWFDVSLCDHPPTRVVYKVNVVIVTTTQEILKGVILNFIVLPPLSSLRPQGFSTAGRCSGPGFQHCR